MIKLLVSSSARSPVTHSFNQPSIVIGSAVSPEVDLPLQDEALEACHLKICEEFGSVYAINISNDPFATVNGLPFGKKQLQPNDIIELGNVTIRFIGTAATAAAHIPPAALVLADTQVLLPEILDKALTKRQSSPPNTTGGAAFAPPTLSAEKEPPLAAQPTESDELEPNLAAQSGTTEMDFDLECIDIDELVRQVEAWDSAQAAAAPRQAKEESQENGGEKPAVPDLPQQPAAPADNQEVVPLSPQEVAPPTAQQAAAADLDVIELGSSAPEPSPGQSSHKKSLKDYYLSEYDDVQDATQLPLNRNGRPSAASKDLVDGSNWKLLLKAFISLIVTVAIVAGLGYLWISDQSEEEEIKAAKSVADVAMALTYAQIKHIRPQNQNWSDPEFIKNNLSAVLASKHLSLAEFDTHGQFTNCPYLLRIYTSHDLSQFLVLAQPAPSVLQWLIPKATVIIDSQSMEMHKINDLKTLNRLLITANSLDGTNAAEISQLVKEGSLIPLSDLVTARENQGFATPKALALIHPGAENLVYNAPRYYHLGEDLMNKSFELIHKSTASHEMTVLQQEIGALSKFRDMVLYSSAGIHHAMQAQKALAVVAPNEKFLIAYLQLTNKGKIASSHLLMDDAQQEIAGSDGEREGSPSGNIQPSELGSSLPEHALVGSLSSQVQSARDTVRNSPVAGTDADREHPVFLQLASLSHMRQQLLKPVSDEIAALLSKHNQSPVADFDARFQALSKKYADVSREQLNKAAQSIHALSQEHQGISAVQFMDWIKTAGIEGMFKEFLATIKAQENFQEPSRGLVDNQLARIEHSTSWQAMEREVLAMADMLTFRQVPDPDRLITYQNATRSRVIQKLNQFLLSANCPLLPEAFDPDQRQVLSEILKSCWICDPETVDFYLSEFDLRVKASQPAPQEIGSKESSNEKQDTKELVD